MCRACTRYVIWFHCNLLLLNQPDFIYTGEHSATQEASIEFLLDILRLSAYWDIEELFHDVQKIIIERRLISPLTLDKGMLFVDIRNAQNETLESISP